MKSSSTAQKVVFALAGRPAPETPLTALTMIEVVSTIEAVSRGAMASADAVG